MSTPTAPATKRRIRLLPQTLSARLVAGVVILVLIVVACAGTGTYFALKPYLNGQVDSQLQVTADGNANFLRRCVPTTDSTSSPGTALTCDLSNPNGPRPDTQYIQILDASGAPLLASVTSDTVKLLPLTSAQATRIVANQSRTFSLTVNGDQLRVTSRLIPRTNGIVVVTGLSTDQETNTLHRLFLLEVVIGGAAIILAFIATAFGVRLSLRPLHRVTATARAVTAELSPEGAGLDRRVEVTAAETGTEAGQLAESVNTLLGAVEEQFAARLSSEQRMRQFLADASHELRTPLTSIRGYAELSRMRRNSAPERQDPEADAETLDRIESEGTRMSRLVEDLLILARGDQRSPSEVGPVEVEEIVAEAVYGARAGYPERQIDIVTQPGLVVGGDHDQLLRVIRNLVTNACVHTAPGGPIRVSAAQSGQWIEIQVSDSGPGLPPEHAAHVFERFWRADSSRARNSGGSGLGLSIVESIVLAHGGTISFASEVATGSTVTVRLPSIS